MPTARLRGEQPTARRGEQQLMLASVLCVLSGQASAASQRPFEIEAQISGLSARVDCRKVHLEDQRTCEMVFNYRPAVGKNGYVSITRTFLGSAAYSDAGEVILDVTLTPSPDTVALSINGQTVALASPNGEPVGKLTMVSHNAFAALEAGTNFSIHLQGGLDATFPGVFSESLGCVKRLVDSSDEDFNAMFLNSRDLTCDYYAHLKGIRIATLQETGPLLQAEMAFFAKEKADADAKIKAATGPAGVRAIWEKLNAAHSISPPEPQ